MPPRDGRKSNRQGRAERCVDAIRRRSGIRPRSRSLARAPETQWRRVHGLPGSQQGSVRGTSMRLIVGIILGCALTVGGAYVADTMATAGAKPVMVNWDVVAKNLDSVTTLARAGWKKIAGRAD